MAKKISDIVKAMKQTAKKTTKSAQTNKAGNSKKPDFVTAAGLRTWNKIMAAVYAVQGAAILLLSAAKTVPFTVSYLTENPLATEAAGETVWSQATRTVADINLAYIIAAFLFISALVHASAAWWWRAAYERDLSAKVARFRWLAAIPVVSLLFIVLASLVGITSLAILLLMVVLSAAAMLLALVTERYNAEKRSPGRLFCYTRTAVAFAPWAVIILYLAGAYLYGQGMVPSYAISAVMSVFLLSVGAALLFRFQNHKKGKWADRLYSERGYVILGLIAQTALAWIVFFGTLQP